MSVTTAAMMPGAGGSAAQERLLMSDNVDVLVIGETREWETVEYARDALQQGRKKALIVLGHAASEEGGMRYCAQWIAGFVKEVPVEFIAAGEPFWAPA
jgi:putative NIF3 family GTP cyclohydrolase 1 type 2